MSKRERHNDAISMNQPALLQALTSRLPPHLLAKLNFVSKGSRNALRTYPNPEPNPDPVNLLSRLAANKNMNHLNNAITIPERVQMLKTYERGILENVMENIYGKKAINDDERVRMFNNRSQLLNNFNKGSTSKRRDLTRDNKIEFMQGLEKNIGNSKLQVSYHVPLRNLRNMNNLERAQRFEDVGRWNKSLYHPYARSLKYRLIHNTKGNLLQQAIQIQGNLLQKGRRNRKKFSGR